MGLSVKLYKKGILQKKNLQDARGVGDKTVIYYLILTDFNAAVRMGDESPWF